MASIKPRAQGIPELAVMANVLNPETESITLNTELETTTPEPATEQAQPLPESTSTTETAEAAVEAESAAPLDADTPTQPQAEAVAAVETTAEAASAPVAEKAEPVAQPDPVIAPPAEVAAEPETAAAPEKSAVETMDFSAALAAFEREQAAEAAAVEAYGDKIVSGKVLKQTEKHLVVDVGLKSDGLVPLEQVLDHTGAVKFQPGDEIEVVIEREEPEGGYLVSYERAQRLRVWDTIEKAAADKTPVIGTVVSRVKGGLTVDIGMKAFLPGSQSGRLSRPTD
jgi:small subunit ribosomal protein S1